MPRCAPRINPNEPESKVGPNPDSRFFAQFAASGGLSARRDNLRLNAAFSFGLLLQYAHASHGEMRKTRTGTARPE